MSRQLSETSENALVRKEICNMERQPFDDLNEERTLPRTEKKRIVDGKGAEKRTKCLDRKQCKISPEPEQLERSRRSSLLCESLALSLLKVGRVSGKKAVEEILNIVKDECFDMCEFIERWPDYECCLLTANNVVNRGINK